MTIGPLLKRLGLTERPVITPDDTHRLWSEIVACRAALLELERVRMMEAHPSWSVEMLAREYRERLARLEAALEAAQPDYQERVSRQVAFARRQALLAEKSAFQEAERQGWLEEDDWKQITDRIDAELIALKLESPEH